VDLLRGFCDPPNHGRAIRRGKEDALLTIIPLEEVEEE
jgi:hypothetical protein